MSTPSDRPAAASGRRLGALLDLRRRAEEESERALGAAIAARHRAEEEQGRLEAAARAARERLATERARLADMALATSDEGVRRARYLSRLEGDAQTRAEAARRHRTEAVDAAAAVEREARAHHLEARREREAIEAIEVKRTAEEARIAGRRADDERDDQALAAFLRRR